MAATPNKEKIARWINGLVAGRTTFDRIELWHASGKKGGGAALHTVHRDEGIDGDEDAEKILEHARNDAATLGDIQLYRLLAFKDEDDSAPVATLTFRIETHDVQGLNGGNDSAAVVAQVLRHNEAMQRIFATSIKAIQEATLAALKQAHDRNATLEERHAKSLDMLEAFIMHNHERELEAKREETKLKREEKLLDTVIGIAPAMLAKLGGKGGLSPALQMFMESLTKDQIEKLSGVLTPEQLISFAEISEIVHPSKEEKGSGS